MTIQDWGVTYDELEPHYDRFEYLCGTSGRPATSRARSSTAAIHSRDRARGPIPIRRSNSRSAIRCSPRPRASSATSRFRSRPATCRSPITNPLGVRLGPCTYCGFCEWFGCGNYSKATPQTTILPVLLRKPNFSARDNMRGHPHQSRRLRQARDRRHLRRHRAARNGSSRPTS